MPIFVTDGQKDKQTDRRTLNRAAMRLDPLGNGKKVCMHVFMRIEQFDRLIHSELADSYSFF